MTHAIRLANLQKVHSETESEIVRLASDPNTPNRHKQLIYGCLNNMCQISARLFGDLSSKPGNYDLLEQAAELDRALLQLRSLVGSHISVRLQQAA
ncbi:MAG: hypothetical protein ABJN75_15420 [Hoeflea sp.]|uniref:hypothetical protein n=1 Tax=Hoeflea sp. TaxID=1940281 RepID=UPI00329A0488